MILRIFLISFFLASSLMAKNYYVSAKRGNDKNKGTKSRPFKTIQKAAEKMQAGDNCFIRTGVYPEILKPRNNGTKSQPLTFSAYHNETVIISGLDQLNQKKALRHGSIMSLPLKTELKECSQIFFDNQPGHEARWPNINDHDFMSPEGEAYDKSQSNPEKIHSKNLPKSWNNKTLKGAAIWCLADKKWSAWTAPVTAYNNEQQILSVNSNRSTTWLPRNHNPSQGIGTFFIYGAKVLLDSPGEWWIDRPNQRLFFIPPNNKSQIAVKSRMWGIDLKNKTHIHIKNLQLQGCSAYLENSQHCLLTGLKILYPSWEIPIRSNIFFKHKSGVYISGAHNTIANSTIAYSSGNGVEAKGRQNKIINCHIHDCNALGFYASPIRAYGDQMVVAYNTLERASRDGLYCKGATRSQFIHNDISHYGLNCSDLGGIYGGGHDFENSLFAYNKVHDAAGRHLNGIYFDNFSQNYIVHNNVIWNITGTSIRLNSPAHYAIIANNSTVSGSNKFLDINNAFGPWKGNMTMSGSIVINNLVSRGVTLTQASRGLNQGGLISNNKLHKEKQPTSNNIPKAAQKAALQFPGIAEKNDPIGAYSKDKPWTAGHDFQKNRKISVAPMPFYRNMLKKASFNNSNNNDIFNIWQKFGAQKAGLVKSKGFNFPGPESRNAIHEQSILLQSPQMDAIQQKIEGLTTGCLYRAACYVRLGQQQPRVKIIIRSDSGKMLAQKESKKHQDNDPWIYMNCDFTMPQNTKSILMQIIKIDPGQAFVDDAGLAPLWLGETDKDHYKRGQRR